MAISKVILNGVTQMDITDTTAIAADVAQGKVFYGADGNRTTGTASGGGGEVAPEKQINFIDFDGTILHSYTASEWASVTALPSNPSHTGLTSQGWNWTKAEIDAQLTAVPNGDIWVGQMYITDDGKTRLYCHFEEGRLHPYLGIGLSGTVVIDWGDGSATDTMTGTSLSISSIKDHVYANGGDYVITLTVVSGEFRLFGTSGYAYILHKGNSSTAYAHRVYSNSLKKIEFGTSVSTGIYAFANCFALESITIPSGVTQIYNYTFHNCYSITSITIPSGVTSIGSYAFQYCQSLSNITIPSGVTSIGSYWFRYCQSLSNITIPSGVTSIGTYAFQYCQSLANITIPSGVTSIGSYAIQYCYSLASITIPSGVTSIGSYAFNSDYGLGEIHFKPTTPPDVSNANVFANISTDCKIYVPAGTLEAYTTATNYPSSSTYTYVEE